MKCLTCSDRYSPRRLEHTALSPRFCQGILFTVRVNWTVQGLQVTWGTDFRFSGSWLRSHSTRRYGGGRGRRSGMGWCSRIQNTSTIFTASIVASSPLPLSCGLFPLFEKTCPFQRHKRSAQHNATECSSNRHHVRGSVSSFSRHSSLTTVG